MCQGGVRGCVREGLEGVSGRGLEEGVLGRG